MNKRAKDWGMVREDLIRRLRDESDQLEQHTGVPAETTAIYEAGVILERILVAEGEVSW